MRRITSPVHWMFLGACLCAACGDAAVRTSADGAASNLPARFAGTVHLQGELARVESGSLFLFAHPPGSSSPTLARKYEIGDPAFSDEGDEVQLRFALDERDRMVGGSAALFDEMEIEARFDPDGILDTSEGVVRASVRARPGDGELSIAVSSGADPSEENRSVPPVVQSPKGS